MRYTEDFERAVIELAVQFHEDGLPADLVFDYADSVLARMQINDTIGKEIKKREAAKRENGLKEALKKLEGEATDGED